MLFPSLSVNQRLPSEPTAMSVGELLAVGIAYSTIVGGWVLATATVAPPAAVTTNTRITVTASIIRTASRTLPDRKACSTISVPLDDG